MWNNFFSHIDIPAENVNILDGNAADPEAEYRRFEKMASYGGVDLFSAHRRRGSPTVT